MTSVPLNFTANTSALQTVAPTLNTITTAGHATSASITQVGYSFVGTNQQVSAFSASGSAAATSLHGINNATPAALTSMQRLSAMSRRVTQSFRVQRGAVQNLGYQFQDVAVQAQMGTSAMVILGQQAPQALGSFGPGGAVLGAVVAISAAMGGVFFASLMKSKKAVEQLKESLEELDSTVKVSGTGVATLAKEIGILAERSEDFAEVRIRVKLIEAMSAMDSAVKIASDTVSSFSGNLNGAGTIALGEFGDRVDLGAEKLKFLSKEFGITEEQAINFSKAADDAVKAGDPQAYSVLAQRVTDLATASGGSNEKLLVLANKLNIASLEATDGATRVDFLKNAILDLNGALEQSNLNGLGGDPAKENAALESLQNKFFAIQDSLRSERQVILDDANQKLAIIKSSEAKQVAFETEAAAARAGVIAERKEKLAALATAAQAEKDKQLELDAKNEAKREKIMLKEMASRERAFKREEALNAARRQAAISFTSESLSIIEDGAKENSGIQKAAFLANKAIAIAEMISNTERGAAAALAFGPVAGPPLSALVRGLGYAGVGVVAGQTIASFEGGGLTPEGSRSGGMDGKGGMLAMLHPNEKVTDLTKGDGGSSSGLEVITNVTINGGSQDAEVTTTSRQISDKKVIVDLIIDQMTRSNSEGRRGLQSTSNVQSRGIR